jgi:hypothetical protein
VENWKLIEADGGLRLQQAPLRAVASEAFTWAHLLYGKLGPLQIGVFYFPSRFNNGTDKSVTKALRSFGDNTGPATSVGIWDTKDPEFSRALALFGLKSVPAVVLTTGLKVTGMNPRGPELTPLYSITLSDTALLSDMARLQSAINGAHDVFARCDPAEIAKYIAAQSPDPILAAIEKFVGAIRNEILKWKPTFGLPGGVSIQLG